MQAALQVSPILAFLEYEQIDCQGLDKNRRELQYKVTLSESNWPSDNYKVIVPHQNVYDFCAVMTP